MSQKYDNCVEMNMRLMAKVGCMSEHCNLIVWWGEGIA